MLKNWTSDAQYIFFPINHEHSIKEAGFHWTLLVFDCQIQEWIFYNSLVPVDKSSNTLKLYQIDARTSELINILHLIWLILTFFYYWHCRKKGCYKFLKLISIKGWKKIYKIRKMSPTSKQVYFSCDIYPTYFLLILSTKNLISCNDFSVQFSVLIELYMYTCTLKV